MVPRQQAKVIRGDLTREKLLTASIDVFGRYGFDGATTRMLTDAAGVNQQGGDEDRSRRHDDERMPEAVAHEPGRACTNAQAGSDHDAPGRSCRQSARARRAMPTGSRRELRKAWSS